MPLAPAAEAPVSARSVCLSSVTRPSVYTLTTWHTADHPTARAAASTSSAGGRRGSRGIFSAQQHGTRLQASRLSSCALQRAHLTTHLLLDRTVAKALAALSSTASAWLHGVMRAALMSPESVPCSMGLSVNRWALTVTLRPLHVAEVHAVLHVNTRLTCMLIKHAESIPSVSQLCEVPE